MELLFSYMIEDKKFFYKHDIIKLILKEEKNFVLNYEDLENLSRKNVFC
jgi:hypothetical protein